MCQAARNAPSGKITKSSELLRFEMKSLSCEFSISRAKKEDAMKIRKLIYEESLHPFGLDWRNFLVVKKNDEIIACGQLRSHGNVDELSSLIVVSNYRRQGIGLILANRLIEQSKTSIYLSGKVELESFYCQLGFNRVNWFNLPTNIKFEFSLYLIAAKLRKKTPLFLMRKKTIAW